MIDDGDSRFLVVPLRSLRVGSSFVGVGVGTRSFNKRLMSNATAFSINNSKRKEVKIAGAAIDQNCHQVVCAKFVIHQFTCTSVAKGFCLVCLFNCWF